MSTSAATILTYLRTVDAQRTERTARSGLNAKVGALKAYQQRRFSHTYADLLQSPRYGPASRFFLDELYGPSDFTQRDAQFARVVPSLVRIFPGEIVDTVAALAELHALSETLDTAMAAQFEHDAVDGLEYVRAWQATGRAADRQGQILLTLDVAGRLDRFTRRVLIRNSLRLMRGPARAAGLAALQRFLETGFDAFQAMGGAEEFISIVSKREQALASILFEATVSNPTHPSVSLALTSLP